MKAGLRTTTAPADVSSQDRETLKIRDGMTETEFVRKLVESRNSYDSKVKYAPIPTGNRRNSNSIVGSTLRASGSNYNHLDGLLVGIKMFCHLKDRSYNNISEEKMNSKISLVIILFILGAIMGCNENKSETWGLNTIGYKDKIVFSEGVKSKDITFTAPKTSSKYELRFYFANVDMTQPHSNVLEIQKEIVKSFDEFEYKIVEKTTGTIIKEGKKSLSFGSMSPLLYWISTKIKFIEGREYIITLKLPSIGKNADLFSDVYFVIGESPNAYL